VNGMTGNHLPAAMRASDADREAVLSELSGHFQAGRLTAAELDERTGRALTARTWGELGEQMTDLPVARPGEQPSRAAAPPLLASLAGLAIAIAVLVTVAHAGWGLIWPLLAILFIARPMIRHLGLSGHRTQHD
jgi:hypothetical protein